MYKKIFILFLATTLFLLSSCTKESKFGVEQFAHRMNSQFEYELDTAGFILGKDENENNLLFYDIGASLITLSLDNNNNIKGISLLSTDAQSISETLSLFCDMCSVFTGNDRETQKELFSSYQINEDTIKYADNNSMITVGKYKYTFVSNSYSVTFFCDRI